MLHNVGKIDRYVRFGLAIVLGVLYFTKVIEGTLGTIGIIAAGILFLTGLRSCCPLYALIGFGTCKVDTGGSEKKIDTGKLDL